MKNYDPNIYKGIHTVEVTIQQWDYVGHIRQSIGGNCKGRTILDLTLNAKTRIWRTIVICDMTKILIVSSQRSKMRVEIL